MKTHYTYWLTDDDGNQHGRDCWYLRDARREAKKLAKELNRDIYINQQENIIEVVFAEGV